MPRTATSEIAAKVVGSVVRDARRHAGVTQAELARRLSTSAPYISSLENGRLNLTIGQLSAVADALGCAMTIQLTDPQLGPEPVIPVPLA